ncbi:MAG: NUDIX hydrolase [Spirosomataceae bacterium]
METNPYLKHIAYDSVIFGFSGEKLKILIMEYRNTGLLALPGGFVGHQENLNDAVKRGLSERTGLSEVFLEQFYTFGNIERYQPEVMEKILVASNEDLEKFTWLLDRYISVAYYALINLKDVNPQPDRLSDSCGWYDVDNLPALILDHNMIVNKAMTTLRSNIDHKLAGVNLLPSRFTMKELQKVYEAILNEKLHRGTFQRKILASGLLKRHEKQYTGAANKAPFLYSFVD